MFWLSIVVIPGAVLGDRRLHLVEAAELMGRLVSTLAMVLVLAGLAGYIYFARRRQSADTDDDARRRRSATVDADDIEEVRIALERGEPARLTKTSGTWKLVEPVGGRRRRRPSCRRSPAACPRSTSSASWTRSRRTWRSTASAPARIDVSFKVKGQAAREAHPAGRQDATGGDIYAKLPDSPRVFLVSSFVESTFKKDPFSLRDKTILKVDRAKVDGFEPRRTARPRSSSPRTAPTGPSSSRSRRAPTSAPSRAPSSGWPRRNMQALTADNATDLKQYGLDKPTATMTVKSGSSSATLTLGKTDNAVVFAKDAVAAADLHGGAHACVTTSIKDVGEFRRKDVFDFRSFTATRRGVHARRRDAGVREVEVEGQGRQGRGRWKDAKGATVDAMKVEDLLTKVSGLRASSFEATAPAALKTPVLTVKAQFDSKTRNGDDRPCRRRRLCRAGRTSRARPSSTRPPLDEALKALDALK